MTTLEYMEKKNEIIYKLTGVTLIPKDQLIEVEAKPLSTGGDDECCPYCVIYRTEHDFTDCYNCPMSKANNECDLDDGSTYDQVLRKLDPSLDGIHEIIEIIALVEEFNKQFEEK